MMTYEFSSHGKIRLRWNELPQTYFHANKTYEYVIFSHSDVKFKKSSRIVVVEMILPRGSRSLYGLLGGRYSYKDEKNLCLKIGNGDNSLNIFNESLISSFEQAYIGLPNEYISSVVNGTKKAQRKFNVLGPGTLEFFYAAHGFVSSNALIFEKLAFIIVNLLGCEFKDISKEQLEKMINLK